MRYFRLISLLTALLLCIFTSAAAEQVEPAISDFSVSELPASNDELFELHFEREIYGMGDISTFGTAARDNLTPRQQKLYDYFKINLQRVANGATAQAYFSIQGAQTLMDMGYPAIANYRGQAQLDMAREAFKSQLFDDFHIVCTAIRFDCPYDLYWHSGSMRISYEGSHTSSIYYANTVTLTFDVDPKYRASYYDELLPTVNTAITNASSMVTQTARQIVSKYAWATDYDKLKGYKNEICNMVSYDHDAANDTTGFYDGGAWDLIYVFDNNAYTNVVCEGYAKAFQYLCDLTVFNSDKIECRTVNGYANGPHRWNIVTMEDGWNYLVDVTNSDTGMSGQYGDLFLTAKASYDAYNKTYTFHYRNHTLSYIYNDGLPYAPEELLLAETATVYQPVYGDFTQYSTKTIAYGEAMTVVGGVYTVPRGVSLINNGVINLVEGARLSVEGYLTGSGRVLQSFTDGLDLTTGIHYQNGKPSTYTGMVVQDGESYYVLNGVLNRSANGLTPVGGQWVYLSQGKLNRYTGMVSFDGGSFYVVDGVLNSSANGLTLVGERWFFLSQGQMQVHYGFAMYNGEWFYLNGGELDLNATGLYEYDGGLFLIAVGRLVQEYTGLAEVGGKWYYVIAGQVQTQFTGYVIWNGGRFLIVRGQMIQSVNSYSALDASLTTVDLSAFSTQSTSHTALDYAVTTPSDLPSAGQRPVILYPVQSQVVSVSVGETATMTVSATGATSYQWYIDRNDGRGFVTIKGATKPTYTTSKTTASNSGYQYYCQVGNASGIAFSATLTLEVLPEVKLPATGDNTHIGLWLALLMIGAAGLTAVLLMGKRKSMR